MVGQGSPSAWSVLKHQFASQQIGLGAARIFLLGLVFGFCWVGGTVESFAAEKTVRLRMVWGSGTATKQRWTGEISVAGGILTELQPLGVEPDAPVAIRIDGSRLIVDPLEKRSFDGCDVTIRADEQALIRVKLRGEQALQPTVIEATVADVLRQQLSQPLDGLGCRFSAHRSPGDVLRVLPTREHLVFDPGEKWELKLQPDLADAVARGTVLLDVQLRAAGAAKPSWRSTQQITQSSQLEDGVIFEITCPAVEGAYLLTISARPEEGFANRFVPGQQAKLLATRDVEFVVIDPTAKLPVLVDHWESVLTIEPSNPSWWQRLPAWAQMSRIRSLNHVAGSGSVGNVRPVVRPSATGDLVELPPAKADSDPYWQAYTLPIREPGQPHLVEIIYPLDSEQHLAISLVEPNAAGHVTTTQQDASLYSKGQGSAADGKTGLHRFVIWPHTHAPQLLIVNRNPTGPGQYGKIRLWKQDVAQAALATTALAATPLASENQRLVAGYLSKPLFADNFGAAEMQDVTSGISVQGWSTFLTATQRLAQSLRFSGRNAIMLSVAADGSSLYPSRVLNPSPRYDTGLVAASGQDPQRKDVLEMMLRVFDREGIRVIPTLQLAAPLPRLETLRRGGDVRKTGIGCVNHSGQSWLLANSNESTSEGATTDGLAPFYNPLNDQVQAELAAQVAELTARYGQHVSLGGIGVQVSGRGYGLMPGLVWGFDDNTMAQFSQATGLAVPGQGEQRFRQRAEFLLGPQRVAWQQWRMEKLTQLYQKLAEQAQIGGGKLPLILATEDVFAGTALEQRVRQAIASSVDFNEILHDHALDLMQLDAQPQITTLLPRRLNATGSLQQQALDIRVNAAIEQSALLPIAQRRSELFYHPANRFRLPSFDQRSPFGAEQTFLTVTSQPHAVQAELRRSLLTSLARYDTLSVVEGGLLHGASSDLQYSQLLEVLKQLPKQTAGVQTQHQQPVVMRVYRIADQSTVVTLVNEAPWSVHARVPFSAAQPCDWKKLGDHELSTGILSSEEQPWQITLQPYDLQAWRFEDAKVRVGELNIELSELAKEDLATRIQELESRAGNLNIQRPYVQLQNPGFELADGDRIVGWQPRQGKVGFAETTAHFGSHAMQMQSEPKAGAIVQSHLFPAPGTGQLMVKVFLRFDRLEEGAQLQITVQDQTDGRLYRQTATIGRAQLVGDGWQPYEFALEDVPSGVGRQLRLHLHLTGSAKVLVDDVQLYDLRFDKARRIALVKRLFAAKIALEQGQVLDCLHVVDDYWSRYLVEHVPPMGTTTLQATRPTPKAKPVEQPTDKGVGSRIKGWVPKMWR